jgi:hypothetical protein
MSCSSICYKIWCWVNMMLLWVSITFTIIAFIYQTEERGFAIFLLFFFYIGYIITNSLSSTCKYIFNKHKSESIHELMKRNFSNPPKLNFHVECYHYETRTKTTTDSEGNTKTESSEEKVVTYSESRPFIFYTWRDTSGLFLLDSHKVFRNFYKTYIKLHIDLEVEFADDITKYDYYRTKDEFYNQNKYRDTHINISESKNVDGFETHNMVRITSTEPFGVNKFFFIIFLIILPFMEFYKIYVDLYCVHQNYKLKKIISSRYNVNSPEYAHKWEQEVPRMVIYNEPQVVYNRAPFPMHDSPNMPSLDEIEEAKNNYEVYEQSERSVNFNAGENYPLKEKLLNK